MRDWRSEISAKLSGLRMSPEREAEVIDELAQHLTDREAELLRAGQSPAEARRLALEELDDHAIFRRDLERAKRTRPGSDIVPLPAAGPTWRVSHIWQDARYAIRSLARDRGYSIAAVLALALGIGGAVAIFAAVDAVLLRPMPFPHADRLVVPLSLNVERGGEPGGSTSYADYTDWRAEHDLFEQVAIYRQVNFDITGYGEPERVEAAQVSVDYFPLIDVRPVAGRTFVADDFQMGVPRVTLLSYGLWQRRFGGASDTVGKTLTISGVPVQIIGILPARAVWPTSSDLFLPLRPGTLNDDVRTRRDNLIFQTLARLKDGVSLERANARVADMAAQLARDVPVRRNWTNLLVPLREYIVNRDVRLALLVLLGAVASVLLIVCANVANLALVRGQARARELAIRLALGASRWRLVQQLVVESGVLAIIGTALGAGVAAVLMRGLVLMAPEGTPFLDTVALDGRVLAATMALTAVAVLLSGLVPALVSSSVRLTPALKDGSAGSGASRRAVRLRHALVVGEIAASVVLLVVAALLVRSFDRLVHVNPGVDVDRVLTGRIAFPARYDTSDKVIAFFDALTARLNSEPGIAASAAASFVPAGTGGFGLGRVFLAEGRPEPPAGPDVAARWNVVTNDYFKAVGLALKDGRVFNQTDRQKTTPVIIVSESFARNMFPDGRVLGQRVRSWRDENKYREIVGIVGDVKTDGLAEREDVSAVYVPYAQDSWGAMLLVVRARSGDPAALAPVVRRAVHELDDQLALASVATMASAARASIATERYAALLIGTLALVAIVLAALGIYAVMGYVFARRRREMGIRLALGASRGSVYKLVFRYGFTLTLIGVSIGAAGAFAVSRWLSTLLFNTSSGDQLAWLTTAVTVIVAATIACLLPARRSAQADPVSALRAE